MSVHHLVANAAQAFPASIALSHDAHQSSWRSFADRVSRRATMIRDTGVNAGSRIAVLAANVPEHLEAQFAVLWAGMILVPLNTRLALAEQQFIIDHAQCSLLLYDDRNSKRAADLAQACPQLSATRLDSIDRWSTSTDSLINRTALPFQPARPRAPAAIIYTGGTTGVPKGVELSHDALLLQALAAKDSFHLDEHTVFVHTAPMFHVADLTAGLGVTAAAARHCFLPEFSPVALLDKIDKESVDVAILVPTMIMATLDGAGERRHIMQRLRTILYGAAPIQEPVLRRLMSEAAGVGLIQLYGQTEVGGACTMLSERFHVLEGPDAGKLGSAGRTLPAFSIRVVDAAGHDVPAGAVGEIVVSGPGVMTSYWRAPELTDKTLDNGWLRTGDLGTLDSDGFLSVVGRLKDMIITGAENVFAGEVESALMYHPAVQAAAVIGVPDAVWGESVHAVVVLKAGQSASEADLIEHCRSRIARYKGPRTITFRNALPLSSVGKVRKVDLLDEWRQSNLR